MKNKKKNTITKLENKRHSEMSICEIIQYLKSKKNMLMLKKLDYDFLDLVDQYRSNKLDAYKKIAFLLNATKSVVSSLQISQNSNINIIKSILKQNFKFIDLALELTPEVQNFVSKIMIIASSVCACENVATSQKTFLEQLQTLENDFILAMIATTGNMTNLLEDCKKVCVFGYCPHLLESFESMNSELRRDIHVLLVRTDSYLCNLMEENLKNMKISTTVTNLQSMESFKDHLQKSILCVDFIFSDDVAFGKTGSSMFANMTIAHCPDRDLIGCCETFKCVNNSSKQWKSSKAESENHVPISGHLIKTLNTEITILRNWTIQHLSNKKTSFNERFYTNLLSSKKDT